MTGIHDPSHVEDNWTGETAAIAVDPDDPIFAMPPDEDGGGDASAGESDAPPGEWDAVPERDPDQAGGKPGTGSANDNPSLSDVVGVLRQLSAQIERERNEGGDRLKSDIKKLAGIADGLTKHTGETRSLLDGLSTAGDRERDVVKAANRLEEAIMTQTGDFQRWAGAERKGRRRWASIALCVAVPAFLLLGLLVEQQYQVIPLHDPTGGLQGFVWKNYGREVIDCAKEASRSGASVTCSFTVREP